MLNLWRLRNFSPSLELCVCIHFYDFILCRNTGRRIGIVSLLTKHLNWLPVVYLGFNLLSWHSRGKICSNFRLASWKVFTNMGQCLFNDYNSIVFNGEFRENSMKITTERKKIKYHNLMNSVRLQILTDFSDKLFSLQKPPLKLEIHLKTRNH